MAGSLILIINQKTKAVVSRIILTEAILWLNAPIPHMIFQMHGMKKLISIRIPEY